jgi:alkanesulfonate monooxygenase SsuD/methylene tetrahydromethanopterin reductase-like flavin-dependent oxidoreductase (luciferase family)
MRVVAKRADWWNLGFRPVEEYARKLAVLREHCDKVGRDPRTLTLTYYTHLKVVEAASEFEPPERGYVLGGTPDKVADELQAFLDLGVRHVMLHLQDFPSPRSLDLFQEQVIPRLNLS